MATIYQILLFLGLLKMDVMGETLIRKHHIWGEYASDDTTEISDDLVDSMGRQQLGRVRDARQRKNMEDDYDGSVKVSELPSSLVRDVRQRKGMEVDSNGSARMSELPSGLVRDARQRTGTEGNSDDSIRISDGLTDCTLKLSPIVVRKASGGQLTADHSIELPDVLTSSSLTVWVNKSIVRSAEREIVLARAPIGQHVTASSAEASSTAKTSKRRTGHQLLQQLWAKIITIEKERFAVWHVAALGTVLFILLACWCLSRGKRWVAQYINSRYNPKARQALLENRRGNPSPSWKLFLEYTQLLWDDPHSKKWYAMMEDEDVALQIDQVFDRINRDVALSRTDVVFLLASIDNGDGDGIDDMVSNFEPSEDDYGWLLDFFDEFYPGPQDLNREAFRDLFLLLVTWRMHRAFAFVYLLTKWELPRSSAGESIPEEDFGAYCVCVRVNLGNDCEPQCEPITVLKYSMDATISTSSGRLTFQTRTSTCEIPGRTDTASMQFDSPRHSAQRTSF